MLKSIYKQFENPNGFLGGIVDFSMLPLKPKAVFYVAGVNTNNSEN